MGEEYYKKFNHKNEENTVFGDIFVLNLENM